MYLSIIIPAYNEEFRISETIFSVFNFVESQDFTFEVIVVDDGSTDRTLQVLQNLQSILPKLQIISYFPNRGKGFAVKSGMLLAKGEFKLFMDADHSVKIENLNLFLEQVNKGNDIVVGSIYLKNSRVKDKSGVGRRTLGHVSNFLIQLLARPAICDTQRGFKLFTAAASEQIFNKLSILRFGFDIEIFVLARLLGLKVKELPVLWSNSKESKVKHFDYIETFIELLKIVKNEILEKY
jgi:dolichyl-phosphate beta-glucosyltransferase